VTNGSFSFLTSLSRVTILELVWDESFALRLNPSLCGSTVKPCSFNGDFIHFFRPFGSWGDVASFDMSGVLLEPVVCLLELLGLYSRGVEGSGITLILFDASNALLVILEFPLNSAYVVFERINFGIVW
jgi:hypothetical protein